MSENSSVVFLDVFDVVVVVVVVVGGGGEDDDNDYDDNSFYFCLFLIDVHQKVENGNKITAGKLNSSPLLLLDKNELALIDKQWMGNIRKHEN
jgi:hypothetical protein